MNLHFTGRAEVSEGEINGFNNTTGYNHHYFSQKIENDLEYDFSYTLTGWHIIKGADITQLRMWARQSSSSSFNWRMCLIKQTKQDDSTSVTNSHVISPTYNFQDTRPHLIKWDIDDFYAEEDDIISLGFERVGTTGSNRYYIYVNSGIIVTRED